MRVSWPERLVPIALLGVAVIIIVVGVVQEQVEEVPRLPFELAEYVGIEPADLGTAQTFDDPAALLVRRVARRTGHVRFIVAGDGGGEHDPGKRALARRMRELCREAPCDFVFFTGDNVYGDGIDTFGAVAEAALPGVDLKSPFLAESNAFDAAARRRAVVQTASLAARVCAGVPTSAAEGVSDLLDEAADAARSRHFGPKFEETFAWLAADGIPAFLVLGNHDWRSVFGAECEIGRSLAPGTAWRLPFYFYRLVITDPEDGAQVLDLLALYSAPEHASPRGENHARIGPRQAAWLRRALRDGDATWRVAVSHHPVWSAGVHTFLEYRSFHRDLLAAVTEAGRPIDLLIAGHNHWLESVIVPLPGELPPALQLVSGALSKAALAPMFARGYPFLNAIALEPLWRVGIERQLGTPAAAFLRRDRSVLARGFALVDLDDSGATVRFFGVGGELYGERFPRASSARRSILASGNRFRSAVEAQRNGAETAGVFSRPAGEHTIGVTSTTRWE